MSPAKRLGLFQSGDLIIVPAGAVASLRMRPQPGPGVRAGAEDGAAPKSRRLLHSLIVARKGGTKQ